MQPPTSQPTSQLYPQLPSERVRSVTALRCGERVLLLGAKGHLMVLVPHLSRICAHLLHTFQTTRGTQEQKHQPSARLYALALPFLTLSRSFGATRAKDLSVCFRQRKLNVFSDHMGDGM
jgi:hypothetical protein